MIAGQGIEALRTHVPRWRVYVLVEGPPDCCRATRNKTASGTRSELTAVGQKAIVAPPTNPFTLIFSGLAWPGFLSYMSLGSLPANPSCFLVLLTPFNYCRFRLVVGPTTKLPDVGSFSVHLARPSMNVLHQISATDAISIKPNLLHLSRP